MNRSPNPPTGHAWAMIPISAVVALLCALLALSPAPPSSASTTASPSDDPQAHSKIQDKLVKKFQKDVGKPQNFWVSFDASADLSAAKQMDDWVERGEYVVQALQQTASKAQTGVVHMLNADGVDHESFWITNAILVMDGSYELASRLADRSEVDKLVAPVTYEVPDPIDERADDGAMTPAAVEWGLENINAPDVWQAGIDGGGIVVANIDTGVQFDHPTLVNQYRGNNHDGTFTHDYSWFDAYGSCNGAPCDVNGHGTHTMGTMAGDDGGTNQIGVAPGATWIAANGCCTTNDGLIKSGQWMLAPTKVDGTVPDVSKRPNIINNSWGTRVPSNDPFLEDISAAWTASGIFGVWANGNNGPDCQTSGSPGSRTINYSVGAYDVTNTIASFSSRGTGQDGEVKPDISAPGVEVRSAFPGDRYAVGSGTSMAAPHAAGAVGLLWSAAPDLVGDIQATRNLLDVIAIDTEDAQCGGDAENNNVYGEGRLDAAALVGNRQVGVLVGQVTDQDSGESVAVARLRIVGGSVDTPIDRTVSVGVDGAYRLGLPNGQYDVTASAYGYLDKTASVTVTEGATTTLDFPLEQAPMVTVSGSIRDGSGHGWPLYAALSFPGYPGNPVFTDPITGDYSLRLPASAEYDVTVDPVYEGYPTTQNLLSVGESERRFDQAVTVDAQACTAPGYGWNGLETTFTGWHDSSARDGWQLTRSGKGGVWQFDNPQQRPQPGSDNQFAIADTGVGSRGKMSTTLTSPPVDLSGQSGPQLSFDTRYLGAARQQAAVEYSTDGAKWQTIWSADTASVYGRQSLSLVSAANSTQVWVRLTFTGGSGDGYWAIDDLFLGTRTCVPHAGGLLVGEVADPVGLPLPGTQVRIEGVVDDTAVSRVFPDDTGAQGAALYWLFAPPKTTQVTAEKPGYQPLTSDVTITQDQIVRRDLQLEPDD